MNLRVRERISYEQLEDTEFKPHHQLSAMQGQEDIICPSFNFLIHKIGKRKPKS